MAASASVSTGLIEFWAMYGPVITGGAVIISAIGALVVLEVNRSIARRRATLDIILHIESDGDIIKARNDIIGLKKMPCGSGAWGTEDAQDTDEAKVIRTILNINELVAVSIAEDVIDERVYRRWFRRAFIDDYRSMIGYIQGVREYKRNPAIFLELQTLAERWENMPAYHDKPGWLLRKRRALREVWRA